MEPWTGDYLKRHEVAKAFESLVETSAQESVFLVHAGFGMGKTFFLQRWAASLQSRGYPVVVFDAWRNDYLESPLAGFIENLRDFSNSIDDNEKKKDILKHTISFAQRAAPIVTRASARIAARILTLGVVEGDIDTAKEIIASEMEANIKDVSDSTAHLFLRSASQKQLHKELSDSFFGLIESIRHACDGKPVYIFIDELDRCRPNFAFDLLEDIKHFLGASGAHFFIFCDENALQSQAATIFGNQRTGENYVSKFYSFRLRLPDSNLAPAALNFLSDKDPESFVNGPPSHYEHFAKYCDITQLSLRECKRLCERLVVVRRLRPNLAQSWPLVNVLCIIHTVFPSHFREFEREGCVTLPEQLRSENIDDPLHNAIKWVIESDKKSVAAFEADIEGEDGQIVGYATSLMNDVLGMPLNDPIRAKRLVAREVEWCSELV